VKQAKEQETARERADAHKKVLMKMGICLKG
jgi:hypothetical protein